MLWLLLVVGCERLTCGDIESLPDHQDVLAIGDSALAWHEPRCRSMPDYLAWERGAAVENRAVNGALMSLIATQYETADWDWVVLSGGGNDLLTNCGCEGDCTEALDDLVATEGASGDIPELAWQIRHDGAQVALIGYYEMPRGAWYGFDECNEEFEELRTRLSDYADRTEGVIALDLTEVVSWEDSRRYYDFDRVHPDPKGARAVAEYVAAAMEDASQR